MTTTAPSSVYDKLGQRDDDDADAAAVAEKHGIKNEAWRLFTLAWPLSISFSFQMASQQLNAVMVGHLGPLELGAATLGLMWCNITGFSIVWGGMTALDTLGSQAYGAKAYTLVGVLAQRALVISTAVAVPVAFCWAYATFPVLTAIGVDTEVASLAQQFTRWYVLALWPQLAINIVNKFLSMQDIVRPPTLVQAVIMPVNAGLTYTLVYISGFGFVGSPIAQAVSCWLQLAAFLVLIRLMRLHEKCWPGLDWREAFRCAVDVTQPMPHLTLTQCGYPATFPACSCSHAGIALNTLRARVHAAETGRRCSNWVLQARCRPW